MFSLTPYYPFLSSQKTPFYFYDTALLEETLQQLTGAAKKRRYHVHYALKANANGVLLDIIKNAGMGADCVSGNEVKKALECGFDRQSVVFAGVGKSDEEMNYALREDIFCFNAESIPELQVINELAAAQNKTANIALRLNPNVDAHTHKYITTGLEENKFGINPDDLPRVHEVLAQCKNLHVSGLHFHIGSQITDLTPFKDLCNRVNELQQWFISRGYNLQHINLGGGLGINYSQPEEESICRFEDFFELFSRFLEVQPGQEIHFELGRSVIAQCGSLISRVLYIKEGFQTRFVILDAGMTELIRPALYQAHHKIENLSRQNNETGSLYRYDVVGPICESSDCFGKALMLPHTQRGDLIAIRSAGAYGEVMSSAYNLRDKAKAYYGWNTKV